MRKKICLGHKGDVINTFKFLVGKSGKVEDHLIDLGVKVRMTIRLVINVIWGKAVRGHLVDLGTNVRIKLKFILTVFSGRI
jgi:L-arabinose isomerase